MLIILSLGALRLPQMDTYRSIFVTFCVLVSDNYPSDVVFTHAVDMLIILSLGAVITAAERQFWSAFTNVFLYCAIRFQCFCQLGTVVTHSVDKFVILSLDVVMTAAEWHFSSH